MQNPNVTLRGFQIFKDLLDAEAQAMMLRDLQHIARLCPPFSPRTPFGKPMSVQMTSAGKYGWYSNRSGYHYVEQHPNGQSWPPIPASIMALWQRLVSPERGPDCCLINYYAEGARMGMHQDRDEADFSWPVLSVSLGDDGLFRIGNTTRGGKTESIWLASGDVVLMGGEARLTYHGVDRIRFGSSCLLPKGGRINLTLRVVE